MKLKKYEAKTEQEAIEMVKDELGLEALILNIKKVQPRGFFSFLRKAYVEVTAAYEDKPLVKINKPEVGYGEDIKVTKEVKNVKPLYVPKEEKVAAEPKPVDTVEHKKIREQQQKIELLEKKIVNAEDLLETVMGKISASSHDFSKVRKYDNTMLQFFYEKLVLQGVNVEIAEALLKDIEDVDDTGKININLIVKIVYNRIIRILGEPSMIDFKRDEKEPKLIFFIGPTGVGKTTTIAKISSNFIINEGVSVGFITADTYRIAAVEQLKTYADILGIDVGVVYNEDDFLEQLDIMRPINDFIFIDTAGRSHKNHENFNELSKLMGVVSEYEVFLVLSVTTKYEDLLNIINVYKELTDFKIIFTKLDETMCLGSILNICYTTGKQISYVTDGQNVPDDIEIINPGKIAKALLGSIDV